MSRTTARRLWFNDRADLDSYFFLLLNANKRSVVVDLRSIPPAAGSR
jgi:crotonobetainyl-CoA:carnitine CoA-transferase CaiB-like acyl-CoA transferase